LAAAALATAANELGAQAGGIGIVFGILVAAIAQMMFFMFTIIGHTIQPARLHWVEFFTKFKYHEETGRAYRPFQKSAT
ncbi:MAG: V-type ATP synthase subunit I, partial [Armatimonadetes bacterium]|nr:V-type ATP synthase subunit I [Armatimonadota bacterium]